MRFTEFYFNLFRIAKFFFICSAFLTPLLRLLIAIGFFALLPILYKFYFIKNLDESTIKGASNFYINVLSLLQDIAQSLEYISKVTFKHVNNNHKALTFNQIRELKEISLQLETLFERTKFAFSKNNFQEITSILDSKQVLLESVREKIDNQISRTKSEESSPKNTTLYFSLLTETKDLIKSNMAMLELYNEQYDSNIEPPTKNE